MALPPLPKALRSFGAASPEAAYARIDQWAKGHQSLARALREGNPSVLRRLDELESSVAVLQAGGGGGGGSFPGYGAHVDLTVGGSGTDGSNTTVSRSDHTHGLPAFGTSAGEFAEGDHTHPEISGGYTDGWCDEAPPESPHSQDDECLGGSVDGKWSTANPESLTFTASAEPAAGRYRLHAVAASGVNHRAAGIYQNIPNSEFSVLLRMGHADDPGVAAGGEVGIFVAAGTATGDSMYVVALSRVSSTSTQSQRRFSKAGWGAAVAGVVNYNAESLSWHRIRVNGTTFNAECFDAGGGLFNIGGSVTLGFTPAVWGLCVMSSTTTQSRAGYYRHVRVASGSGASNIDALTPGRQVRYLIP